MHADEGKPQEVTTPTFWQKLVVLLSGIRVRLTLWYMVTTAAILALFSGLLLSTIAKMMPAPNLTVLLRVALNLFWLGLALFLFILAGGYWLAVRAMRPVRLITRTTREIGRTDLSRRFHLTSRDELGELADTFNEMLDRLEAVLNRQRQFTADASHELRTPLSLLTLATSRALSQRDRPESYAQALTIIAEYRREFSLMQAETDHMTRLVNDLLLLARADTEQTTLVQAEVDMSEVALEVVERFAPLAQQRGMELVFGELPELRVRGDRLLLTVMVTNVIDNALKHTAGIGNHVLVEGSVARKGRQIWGRIGIEDNGPGIAEEHQSHLFERFYQVNTARSQASLQKEEKDFQETTSSGSGLGLAIVQWVAHMHQGEIRLHSILGHGSCFEIWLPLLDDSRSDEDESKDTFHLQL